MQVLICFCTMGCWRHTALYRLGVAHCVLCASHHLLLLVCFCGFTSTFVQRLEALKRRNTAIIHSVPWLSCYTYNTHRFGISPRSRSIASQELHMIPFDPTLSRTHQSVNQIASPFPLQPFCVSHCSCSFPFSPFPLLRLPDLPVHDLLPLAERTVL